MVYSKLIIKQSLDFEKQTKKCHKFSTWITNGRKSTTRFNLGGLLFFLYHFDVMQWLFSNHWRNVCICFYIKLNIYIYITERTWSAKIEIFVYFLCIYQQKKKKTTNKCETKYLEYAYKGYINAEKYFSEGLGYSSNLNTNICTMFLTIVPNYVQKRR